MDDVDVRGVFDTLKAVHYLVHCCGERESKAMLFFSARTPFLGVADAVCVAIHYSGPVARSWRTLCYYWEELAV